MKVKKIIIRTLIALMIISMGIGTIPSFAADSKNLKLSYFRYTVSEKSYSDATNGYALNTAGNEGESGHPIYQILALDNNSQKTGINLYCLNATAGDTWNSPNAGTTAAVTYNQSYNLATQKSEIANLDKKVYSNVVNSNYYKQIMWILDNIYIPSTNLTDAENLANKQAVLAKAGIMSNYELDMETGTGDKVYGYRYVPVTGYDYSNFVSAQGKIGYKYMDSDRNLKDVVLSDDMVQAIQQAALWYFTNYQDENNNPNKTNTTYNAYLNKTETNIVNWLKTSNGSTNTNTLNWPLVGTLSDSNSIFVDPTTGNQVPVPTGAWLQEQATVLYDYLIDAANNYASSNTQVKNPLTITSGTDNIKLVALNNTNYYVVGPITINEQNSTVYELNDSITVNDSTTTGAYISDANGNNINKTVNNVIGQEFYVTVPKSKITGNNINIKFTGSYKTNEKNLWVVNNGTEQPIVEVKPASEPIVLQVTATIEKEFDLSLRKAITKLTNSAGTAKLISNEEGKLATRNVTYVATDILSNGTATYNHRKDPVVVEKGDIITYSISVYNEGDMPGYAETIVDKLPKGLILKGYKSEDATTTVGKTSDGKYSYVYNPQTNEITFTNLTKNVLAEYDGGSTLSSETITIECEVTEEPSSTTNTYLTNIAYIAKEYNTETNQEVVTDRDSSTTSIPSATQIKTEDKYTGYHGGNNQNGDNSKDVYNDGTNNDDYFPGREDDDDFEVIVIKPAEFDLALQKYISSVNGAESAGRQAPTIDTSKLANKTATTATYKQDKTAIKVKNGDYVTYTFRVYNEGEKAGYVNKITDNIPSGLQFVYQTPNSSDRELTLVNSDGTTEDEPILVSEAEYALVANNSFWNIDKNTTTGSGSKTDTYNGETTISVTYNGIDSSGRHNLKELKAYDSSKDVNNNGAGLDYVDVQLVLRVSEPNSSKRTIRNEAAITEAEDLEGIKQDTGALRDRDSQINQWPGKDGDKKYQDDEDYDNIVLAHVDLALTKFITAVSEDAKIEDGEYITANGKVGSETNPYLRATKVNTNPLKNGTSTDAIYTLVKTPLQVPEKAYVLYNIRVYNEGDVDVFAGEVKDYLPNYLDFVSGEDNDRYGWKVASDGKTVTTTYLASETGRILGAFDKAADNGEGSHLKYRDLPILCRVNNNAPENTNLVNSAEITKYEDENGNNITEDVDSKPGNLKDEDKNKEGKPEGRYNEDDEDYEAVYIKKKKVDLALTKFITAISEDEKIEDGEYLTKDKTSKDAGSSSNPFDRATKVNTNPLKEGKTDAEYTMVKDPLTVATGDYVLYNIRVYNEGEVDVYAGEVTDYLPDYLDFVSCEINDEKGWKVDSDGKTVRTSYLSSTNGTDKILKAFDKVNDDGEGSKLDYQDLPILCRVNNSAPTGKRMVNSAAITKYEDKDGKEIDKDVDSDPKDLPDEDKNKEQRNQDDDDYEVIIVKTFDLSLLKYVSTVYVTEDGKSTTIATGNVGDSNDIIPKVEIKRKKINSTTVKFGYTIKITNEGDIAGYAKEITDYVPEGLKFYSEDNTGWTDEGDNVIKTRLLENTLLQPGESATVTVIFRWINGSNNLGLKTNTAEISEDYNKEGVPDRDSTPNNKKPGEDDIDTADVLLSISTGLTDNIIRYATYSLVILAVLATGIILIRKFVL